MGLLRRMSKTSFTSKIVEYMKHSLIFVVLAACVFVACSKDQDTDVIKDNSVRVITAVHENVAKTSLDDMTPKWAVGDMIDVRNSGGVKQVITLTEEMINEDGTCSFTTSLTGDLYAVYPSTSANGVKNGKIGIKIPATQKGTFAEANICVAYSSDNTLTFKNATAVLKLSLGEGVAKVGFPIPNMAGQYYIDPANAFSASVVSDRGDIVTLAPDSPSTGVDYYVAVAPIAVPKGYPIVARDGDSKIVGSKRITKENTLARNTIYNLGQMTANGQVFTYYKDDKVGYKVGVLAGGNLCWDGNSFGMMPEQYEYYTERTDTKMSHFFWSKNAADACGNKASTIANGDKLFADGGKAIKGWSTMNKSEFDGLFNKKYRTETIAPFGCFTKATVHNIKGLVIFPDGYQHPAISFQFDKDKIDIKNDSRCSDNILSDDDWAAVEDAGAVFLPFAGFVRATAPGTVENTTESTQPRGDYWQNSLFYDEKASKLKVCFCLFQEGSTGTGATGDPNIARTIRLICK